MALRDGLAIGQDSGDGGGTKGDARTGGKGGAEETHWSWMGSAEMGVTPRWG